MKSPICVVVVTVTLLATGGCRRSEEPKTPRPVTSGAEHGPSLGRVDPNWLERAQRYDQASGAAALVREFARAHPSKALEQGLSPGEGAYLNLTTVNLDEDPEPEHLLFIGADAAHTMFYVIDRRGDEWAIAFEEYVDLFNEEPELYVLNQPSPNKVFYLRTLHERGSGIWLFTYRFFRLIGGRVHEALEIVQESNLQLDASELYQNAESIVRSSPDGISVKYRYRFAPSQRLLIELGVLKGYSEDSRVVLIDDEDTVSYTWDGERNQLVPRASGEGLTEEKVRCLMDLGKADRFATAFGAELKELATKGSAAQKTAAAYFLGKVPAGGRRTGSGQAPSGNPHRW